MHDPGRDQTIRHEKNPCFVFVSCLIDTNTNTKTRINRVLGHEHEHEKHEKHEIIVSRHEKKHEKHENFVFKN
jgi:hypothetical protein